MLFTKFATIILIAIQTGGPAPPPPAPPGGITPPGLPVPLDANLWVLVVVAIIMVIIASKKISKKPV
jgi:hypothetical protein